MRGDRRRRHARWPRRSAHDDRIGGEFLDAGLGFGGGCLPKDIRAFMARAGELGVDQALTFLREVDAINMRRRERGPSTWPASSLGGSFDGRSVAVLGAAFKPDSDDVRDSPALDVAGEHPRAGRAGPRLRPEGDGQRRASGSRTLTYADDVIDAAQARTSSCT